MARTFAKLAEYMKKESANIHMKGRTSKYSVPDVMNDGMSLLMTKEHGMTASGDDPNEGGRVDIDDEMEVEDDGSLDID